jgi:hypothetical protein
VANDPSPPSSDNEPEAPHRGMISRADLDFLPKVNWRFWGPVLFVLVAFPSVWLYLRHRDLEARRAELLREHATLTGSLAPRYNTARDRIETAILRSVGPYEGDLRDPVFTWEALAREPVLYARTRLGEIHDRADLAASVRHRYADQLLACLGVEFLWARELFDKGAFLRPSYVDSVRGADTPERVNALRADLRVRMQRDQEFISHGLARPYLMLAVDESRLSIEGPTRVYVYDLRDGRPLVRTRGEGNDLVLVPFRIAGLPAPAPGAPRGRPLNVSQHDCSIANSVRRAIGVPVTGLVHGPEPETREADDASAESDAAAPRD